MRPRRIVVAAVLSAVLGLALWASSGERVRVSSESRGAAGSGAGDEGEEREAVDAPELEAAGSSEGEEGDDGVPLGEGAEVSGLRGVAGGKPVAGAIVEARARFDLVARARSDREGRFVLAVAAKGWIEVRARHADGLRGDRGLDLSDGLPPEPIVISMVRAGRVSVL